MLYSTQMQPFLQSCHYNKFFRTEDETFMEKKVRYILTGAAAVILLLMGSILLPLSPTKPPDEQSAAPQPESTGPSPVAVVRAYFDAWNETNLATMENILIESEWQPPVDYEVQLTDHVELLTCKAEAVSKSKIIQEYPGTLFESAIDIACVITDCVVYYNDLGQEVYQTESHERTGFRYWLIKQTVDGAWRIAMQGY